MDLSDLIKAISERKEKTRSYDTTAVVRRIEGRTAWVHIPGGVEETPVKMTIKASPGDTVQIRIGGGKAWITGNATAPPTDDTLAMHATRAVQLVEKVVSKVKEVAESAQKIAGNTNQYFWHTEEGSDTGAHITEIPQEEFLADPENGGGNLLARSNGIAIRKGLQEIATFSGDGLSIQDETLGETAHIGYGNVKGSSGSTEYEEYVTFGKRRTGEPIGAYSFASGTNVEASAYASCAVGASTRAKGIRSIAFNRATIASGDDQTVIGRYNAEDQNGDYAFIIGSGASDSARVNAFAVDWNGNIVRGDGTASEYVYQVKNTGWLAPSNLSSVSLSSGGYYIEGKRVYVQMTLTTTAQISNTNNVTIGQLPAAAGSLAVLGITIGNKQANYSAQVTTGGVLRIKVEASIASGATINITGVYTMR